MTTVETVTPKQIGALRREAAAAGDYEMVRLCDRAWLTTYQTALPAIRRCVAAINAAETVPAEGAVL